MLGWTEAREEGPGEGRPPHWGRSCPSRAVALCGLCVPSIAERMAPSNPATPGSLSASQPVCRTLRPSLPPSLSAGGLTARAVSCKKGKGRLSSCSRACASPSS